MKKALIALLAIPLSSEGVTITYNLINPSALGTTFRVNQEDGDAVAEGALIELGVFSSSLFDGEWIPLASTSFGAGGQGDGYFQTAVSIDFDTSPATEVPFGQELALRVYDGPTDRSSFNTASKPGDGRWTWPITPGNTPDQPQGPVQLLFSDDVGMEDPSLVWEDGLSPFQTTIAIPEPSTSLAALFGLAFFAGARRRK